MRTSTRIATRQPRPVFDDEYFERKARDLVAPDEEIEAWELDASDLDSFADGEDFFNSPGSE